MQGLALGGEYGGAAVYVAEHAPDNKRGFYTSFIQITATLGLFVSLMVILGTQSVMTKEQFADWGWRIPFLLSIILVSISLYIRLKMRESPIFSRIKASGMTSAKPLTEAFTVWPNLKRVLISLFGATAGQGVIWYTGQFYALFYLQAILKVNPKTSNIIVAVALLLGMPFFTLFGALSDRVGRKWLMMAACLLSIVSYIPIYKQMQAAAGNNIVTVRSTTNKVTGAISLTPITIDATGQQIPAKEATSPNVPMLVFLVFLQVIFVCMIYGPIAAYLVEAFPARIRYTSLVPSLSHRQRRLWRFAAAHRPDALRAYRQHLRRFVLPHDRGRGHLTGGQLAPEGNARHPDLGRVQPCQTQSLRRLTAQLSW